MVEATKWDLARFPLNTCKLTEAVKTGVSYERRKQINVLIFILTNQIITYIHLIFTQ